MLKFLEVREDSLSDLGEYLELDYSPVAGWVENWGGFTDEGYDEVESLLVQWGNGGRTCTRECNQNLDYLINSIIYEEEE